MKLYFDKATTIPAGVALKLTPEQTAVRIHLLEPFGKKKQVYVSTQALQFKSGESVEIAGDLPKGILPAYDQNKKQIGVKTMDIETEEPDTEEPDTEEPDTEEPDTEEPDTEEPDE
jgi:hypothetical protein